jgi:hypothetical protein
LHGEQFYNKERLFHHNKLSRLRKFGRRQTVEIHPRR